MNATRWIQTTSSAPRSRTRRRGVAALVATFASASIAITGLATPAPASAAEASTAAASAETTLVSHVDEATMTFDHEAAVSSGIERDEADDFAAGFAANGGIVTGSWVDDGERAAMAQALAACNGVNQIVGNGSLIDYYFDSCFTNTLQDQLNAQASVATLTGIIAAFGAPWVSAASAAAALLFGQGSYAISRCNVENGGIIVSAAGCRHQVKIAG